MMRLRHQELRRFSAAVGELAHDPAPGILPSEHLLKSIAGLVSLDRVSYNEMDRDTGRVVLAHSMGEPPAPNLVLSLNVHIREHPGFNRPDSASNWPAPTKISDFLTQRQFRQLGLYHDHFRLYGIHYQHGVAFAAGPSRKISFGLNRAHRDFPEETRTLLTLLRPHLAHAHARARSHAELEGALRLRDAALDAVAVVLLGPGNEIAYCSLRARALLDRFFPSVSGPEGTDGADGSRLPGPLARWVSGQRGGWVADPGFSPLLTFRRGERKLLARLLDDGQRRVLRLADGPAEPSSGPLRVLGLTGRESEVLLWLAQGKRDAEIGLICRLHPMTVSTHVRNLLAKLGCETRTAAAALVWEKLGEGFV